MDVIPAQKYRCGLASMIDTVLDDLVEGYNNDARIEEH